MATTEIMDYKKFTESTGYHVDEILGIGINSEVRKVSRDGKSYALKVIHDDSVSLPFISEVSMLNKVRNSDMFPYVVDTYMDQNNYGIILPLMYDSRRLLRRRNKRAMSARIVNSLAYLHEHGILHDDLKPENILADISDTLYISDFGSSKFVTNNTRVMGISGTLWYRAPEILLGQPHSFEADIWSIGLVLLYMFTGIELKGYDEATQLALYIHLLGTVPGTHKMPASFIVDILYGGAVTTVEDALKAEIQLSVSLDSIELITSSKFNLLKKILHFNPCMRPSAREILEDEYFRSGVVEVSPSEETSPSGETSPLGETSPSGECSIFKALSPYIERSLIENKPVLSNGVTKQDRDIIVDWLISMCLELKLQLEILTSGVTIFDIYTSKVKVEQNSLQIVSAASMILSMNTNECLLDGVDDFVYFLDVTRATIRSVCYRVLSIVQDCYVTTLTKLAKAEDKRLAAYRTLTRDMQGEPHGNVWDVIPHFMH